MDAVEEIMHKHKLKPNTKLSRETLLNCSSIPTVVIEHKVGHHFIGWDKQQKGIDNDAFIHSLSNLNSQTIPHIHSIRLN